MARFRKVDPRIWNDEKFASLSDHAKMIFLLLLTHPNQTSLGAMRATVAGLAAELKWTPETLSKGFGELSRKGLVEVDETASFVCLPNFIRYNPPENPNVVKSWSGIVDLVPECDLQVTHFQRVREFVKGLGEGFAKGLPKGFGQPFRKGMPNPEPEPEPEPEPLKTPHSPPAGGRRSRKQAGAKFDPLTVALPSLLDTPEFRAAWADWCQHRIEIKHPLTETQTRKQLASLAEAGHDRAIAMIRESVCQGWRGLFPAKADPPNGHRPGGRSNGQPLTHAGLRSLLEEGGE